MLNKALSTLSTFAALATIAIAGCGGQSDAGRSKVETHRAAVRTAVVQQEDFPVKLRLSGTLKGDRQTTIAATVHTTISMLDVRTGQRVTEDQRLLLLDPGSVQSQYHQTEAVYRNAEKQLANMKALYDAGAISERELDLTNTEFEVARANFESARQTVEIESPISGVVTDVYVRVGDEVSPGTPLVEVANIDVLRLILEVPSSQIEQLAKGQPVTATLPSDPERAMQGTVHSIADAADRNTRTFEVEVRFAQTEAGFAPGTFVEAEVETDRLLGALIVPSESVLYRTGRAYTYALSADTAWLVPIRVLGHGDGIVAIEGGIEPGQKVVTAGQKNLTSGAPVREAES